MATTRHFVRTCVLVGVALGFIRISCEVDCGCDDDDDEWVDDDDEWVDDDDEWVDDDDDDDDDDDWGGDGEDCEEPPEEVCPPS